MIEKLNDIGALVWIGLAVLTLLVGVSIGILIGASDARRDLAARPLKPTAKVLPFVKHGGAA